MISFHFLSSEVDSNLLTNKDKDLVEENRSSNNLRDANTMTRRLMVVVEDEEELL